MDQGAALEHALPISGRKAVAMNEVSRPRTALFVSGVISSFLYVGTDVLGALYLG